ncbi:hypothetical protein F0P96_01565 [Hymenobacter busanensis]|uniref:Uncharacterized protein n=1 Tax=Hymenobacter busanensis TaxID=2607656 RepID=A0A7L5A293_9BACT|nr:hypothetical protein F0P96_01565 [Hymenobacter busanensis]QHJ09621.1 hypothetical protein GUY19_06185 [Hymenobacter busanensis]
MSRWLRCGIAVVWLINGLLCKVLHLVPRHEAIVARILGPEYAAPLTRLIGVAEIGMACWVLSRRWIRLSVTTQVLLVAVMNVLEYLLAVDLLLWQQFNLVFAAAFIALLCYYGFGRSVRPTTAL